MNGYAHYPVFDEPALLLIGNELGDGPSNDGYIVETWTQNGRRIHLTRRNLPGDPDAPLQLFRGNATFVEHDGDENPWHELVAFSLDDSINVLDCLPDDLGHRRAGEGFKTLERSIEHEGAWCALEEAFRIPDILNRFWDAPASLRHHHAYPGGLAVHSVDMARRVAATFHDKPFLRDIGVVVALLHDIGKVWAYDGDQLTEAARTVGHEILGSKYLEPMFASIETRWPTLAWQLRGLLWGGRWANSIPRVEAVRRVIRSLDGFDASMDFHGSEERLSPQVR